MAWTDLRACYGFTMRVFVGGQPVLLPARWFWCTPGAQRWPTPRGCCESPFLGNAEVNNDWGEVTPYPTDPNAAALRTLDRGANPGYPGLCSVGDPQWFVDGQLPAGILDGTPPPFSACCRPAPASATGGLILAGAAIVQQPVCQPSIAPVQIDLHDGQGRRATFLQDTDLGEVYVYTNISFIRRTAVQFHFVGGKVSCITVGYAVLRASPPFDPLFFPVGVFRWFYSATDAEWWDQGVGTNSVEIIVAAH